MLVLMIAKILQRIKEVSNFVEIGDVICPWGSSNHCIVISKMNEDRVAKCIWNDGEVGSVYIDNITFYGKVFKDFVLTKKEKNIENI